MEAKTWDEARKVRLLQLSASQIETYRDCHRKWWLDKVRKLPTSSSHSQVFGTVVHSVIERYLLADDLGRDPATGQPVELYPTDWHIAKDRWGKACTAKGCGPACRECFGTGFQCEGAISPMEQDDVKKLIAAAIENGVLERLPGRRVEAGFSRTILKHDCPECQGVGHPHDHVLGPTCDRCKGDGKGTTVTLTGFVDVLFRDQVQDHKTTSSMRWAKSPAALQKNTQMLIYAFEALEQAKARGEPLPATIILRHNVYCAKENKVRKTETSVSREAVEAHWNQVLRDCTHMVELRDIADTWHDIKEPDNVQICNSYGGCPFREICGGLVDENNFEKRLKNKNLTMESAPTVAYNSNQTSATGTAPTPTQRMQSMTDAMARMRASAAAGNRAISSAPAAPAAPVALNPPAPAPAPVQAAAATVAPPPVVAAPAATPSRFGPVVDAELGETVAPPPWTNPDCQGCRGVGFNTSGNPCRICDVKAQRENRPMSSAFTVEALEGFPGIVSITPRDGQVGSFSYLKGVRSVPVQAQEKVALLPVQQPPHYTQPVPVAPTAPAPVPAAPVAAPTMTYTPEPAKAILPPVQVAGNITPLPLPVEAMPEPGKRKRRTKAEMEADEARLAATPQMPEPNIPVAAEAPANGACCAQIAGDDTNKGFVMLIGAAVIKGDIGLPIVYLEDLLDNVGAELAKTCEKGSYYELPAFDRRDAIAAKAAEIAASLQGNILVCTNDTPDAVSLREALRPYAQMVVVSVK